jgi:hypothetical protein
MTEPEKQQTSLRERLWLLRYGIDALVATGMISVDAAAIYIKRKRAKELATKAQKRDV